MWVAFLGGGRVGLLCVDYTGYVGSDLVQGERELELGLCGAFVGVHSHRVVTRRRRVAHLAVI